MSRELEPAVASSNVGFVLMRDVCIQIEMALRSARAREACGFLLGQPGEVEHRVVRLVTVRNVAEEVRAFAVSSHDRERVLQFAQDEGLAPLALFHTHLSPSAGLSEKDRAGLRSSDLHWCVAARAPVDSAGACGDFALRFYDRHTARELSWRDELLPTGRSETAGADAGS